MTIQFNGNLSVFAKEYTDAVRELEKGNSQYHIILRFAVPVSFHYSKWVKDNRVMEEHTIRKLFFPYYDWKRERVTSVCYVPTFMRSSGYPLDVTELREVEIVDTTQSYKDAWTKIAESLRKFKINTGIAEAIEAHVHGKAPYIQGFQNYWKVTDRPRLMSFADVTNGLTIEQMVMRAGKSQFGNYNVLQMRKTGTRRDRSIELTIRENGEMRFLAASEYAGCGNGDYYCMYSPAMAFYTETD